MLHTPQQFTPRQMLESARRAEADGNMELANQLYWHLSETHPHTAEGAEAYSSLARIGFSIAQQQALTQANVLPQHGHAPVPQAHVPSPVHAPAPGGWNGNGMPAAQHAPMHHAPQGPSPYPMPQVVTAARVERGMGPAQNGSGMPAARGRRLPAVRPAYGFGSTLARIAAGFGWMFIVLGFALPAISIAGVLGPLLPLVMASIAGVVLIGGGMLAVLVGQIAQAVFDQANATRELVSIERAKWGEH